MSTFSKDIKKGAKLAPFLVYVYCLFNNNLRAFLRISRK